MTFLTSAYLRLKVIYNAVRLTSNPDRTDSVFNIADALYKLGAFNDALTRFRSQASAREFLTRRHELDFSQMAELANCAEGTLGRVYSDHMSTLNLDPLFFRARPITDDLSYIVMRLRQTHDLWHVVTGFSTDVRGEISLQAFMMSAMALPLALFIVGSSLIRTVLTRPSQIGELSDAISRGVLLGQKAKGIFEFDWEANWSTPLSEIRAELGLCLGPCPSLDAIAPASV